MKTALIAIVLTVAAMLAGTWLADRWHTTAVTAAYGKGKADAEAACTLSTAKATTAAEQRVRAEAANDLAEAASAAQAREVVRTVIDTRYIKLQREAAHAPVDDVDLCVLPAERLRRWSEANTSPTGTELPAAPEGASAAEPDAAASAADSASLGPDARAGARSPARGPGLSPARSPALRLAHTPAGLHA